VLADENGFHYLFEEMYVCVCKAVTHTKVEEAIDGGACTVAEVTRACGAGGDCGACRGMIEDMIDERTDALVPAAALVRIRAA
jgi:bacterioferritin-associated ferredoxin